MIFVFGGAYQGKQEFVKEQFGIEEEEFYECTTHVDFSRKVLCKWEALFLVMVKENRDVQSFLEEHLPALQDKIILVTDISNGVVPMDPLLRKWREETSRAMTLLSKNAEEVYRVYCGIATKLK